MSEIKILHLFADLMSLYGEYGNIAILKKVLCDNGHTVAVDRTDRLPDDISGYALVYVGSGTEEDIIEACKRLDGAASAVQASLASGTQWLITGTAMALLGTAVTYRENRYSGLGLYDFVTEMDCQKRWQGDVMTTPDNCFNSPCIGYINTSSTYIGDLGEPAFTLALGAELGNDKLTPADGIVADRLLATQLIGPLLVKNPHILQWIYERLTGDKMPISQDDPQAAAYDSALSQLQKRM